MTHLILSFLLLSKLFIDILKIFLEVCLFLYRSLLLTFLILRYSSSLSSLTLIDIKRLKRWRIFFSPKLYLSTDVKYRQVQKQNSNTKL